LIQRNTGNDIFPFQPTSHPSHFYAPPRCRQRVPERFMGQAKTPLSKNLCAQLGFFAFRLITVVAGHFPLPLLRVFFARHCPAPHLKKRSGFGGNALMGRREMITLIASIKIPPLALGFLLYFTTKKKPLLAQSTPYSDD
jgi:hypothetical protein